jgi:hypothetical protein
MPLWLTPRLIAYAIAAAAVAGLLWWVRAAGYKAGKADGEAPYIAALTASAAAYAEAAAHQQTVVDDLTAKLGATRQDSAIRRARLQEVLTRDPESVEWAAVPVPGAVRRLLDGAGGDDLPSNTDRPDGAVPSPSAGD